MTAPPSEPAGDPAASESLTAKEVRQDALLLAAILLPALACGFLFPEVVAVLSRIF